MSQHTFSNIWPGRAEQVKFTVQIWKDAITPALAQRSKLKDGEELAECTAGYVDPRASWEAVAIEMTESFLGAAIRTDEVLDELLAVLDEAAGNERVLASLGEVLGDVRRSLEAVRREAACLGLGLAKSIGDLDAAVTTLEDLAGPTVSTSMDRRCYAQVGAASAERPAVRES